MYKQFAKLAYDPEGCKTTNPREMWLQVERTMPYEGSIYCDVNPWPSSVRVLVSKVSRLFKARFVVHVHLCRDPIFSTKKSILSVNIAAEILDRLYEK